MEIRTFNICRGQLHTALDSVKELIEERENSKIISLKKILNSSRNNLNIALNSFEEGNKDTASLLLEIISDAIDVLEAEIISCKDIKRQA